MSTLKSRHFFILYQIKIRYCVTELYSLTLNHIKYD